MRVKQILTNVQLVIADLEVHLNGELRTSPTLRVHCRNRWARRKNCAAQYA
jgi:hypothetical protein